MENFFNVALPNILSTYAQYRLASDQQKRALQQAAQQATYAQPVQQSSMIPILLGGAALLALIAISRK